MLKLASTATYILLSLFLVTLTCTSPVYSSGSTPSIGPGESCRTYETVCKWHPPISTGSGCEDCVRYVYDPCTGQSWTVSRVVCPGDEW